MSFSIRNRSEKRSEMIRNDPKRSEIDLKSIRKRSETQKNGPKRSEMTRKWFETVRNGSKTIQKRSKTVQKRSKFFLKSVWGHLPLLLQVFWADLGSG